jgi:hypothetical protein
VMREYQGVRTKAKVCECSGQGMELPWLEAPPLAGAEGWGALLYFHHQGQDHWTTMRLFVKELAKRMLDLVFDK